MPQGWELHPEGPLANAIERANLASLDHAVEALVLALLARPTGVARIPDEDDLRNLHRVATHLLLRRPGRYRRAWVHLKQTDGYRQDGFDPPAPRDLPRLMRAFGTELARRWRRGDALDVAAFAMWRILNLHPFANGNGRAATAFAYACLCVKLGGVLPGKPTLLQQQTTNSLPSYDPLMHGHTTFAKTGRADLKPLAAYLDGLLLRQMKSARRPSRGRARRLKQR